MNKKLLDILSNSNKEIDNQKIMDYLSGRLDATERNEVERWLAEETAFSEDALQGLATTSTEKLLQQVDLLNKGLHNQLRSKKGKRKKTYYKDTPWNYLAIFILLALAVAAFWVIRILLST